jgi:NitT/TauT family transport system substrate-binding protein
MVAMTRYSATDLLTDIALKEAKTKYPAYKVQINDVGVRLHMMLNNEMDAAWFTEPQATAARAAGHFMMKDSRKDSLQLGVLAFRTLDVTQGKRPQELALFLKAYNAACERINRNGVQYYAPLIKKYMDATDQTIGRLPKLSFPIAAEPRQKDVDKAAAL